MELATVDIQKKTMDIRNEMLAKFHRLTGTWVSKDTGYASAYEPKVVAEKVTFEVLNSMSVIKYVQKSYQGGNIPTNTEFGFLYIQEDGSIHVNNAGFKGRIEVLTGQIFLRNDKYVVELVSVKHKNDDRIVRTRREVFFDNDELVYKLFIQTKKRSLHKVKEVILQRKN